MSRPEEERDAAIKSIEGIRLVLSAAADKIESCLDANDQKGLLTLAQHLRHALKQFGYVKSLDD